MFHSLRFREFIELWVSEIKEEVEGGLVGTWEEESPEVDEEKADLVLAERTDGVEELLVLGVWTHMSFHY